MQGIATIQGFEDMREIKTVKSYHLKLTNKNILVHSLQQKNFKVFSFIN